MTAAEASITLEDVAGRLDGLTDLFKRRLLEDRAKLAIIDDLQTRLTRAERALDATSLKPLVDGVALVIERVQAADPSADLRTSVVDELEYVLESLGITRIAPDAGASIDRLRHEVTMATGAGADLQVASVVRAGYEKDGVILRAAKITALRRVANQQEESPDSGTD